MYRFLSAPLFLLLYTAQAIAADVALDAALAAVRRGNLQTLAHIKVSPSDLPDLVRYSTDHNLLVRREAVRLLATLGERSCSPMANALTDADADNRERAASLLQRQCPDLVVRVDGANAKLRASISRGNASAYALTLLSHSSQEIDKAFVATQLHNDRSMVKAESSSRPVPMSVAAALAASVMKLPDSAAHLTGLLSNQRYAEFFAASIGAVQDRNTLSLLVPLLDDQRSVASGVPSHAKAIRRVCDAAADQFIVALRLEGQMPPRIGSPYTDTELIQLRQQIAALTVND